MKHFKLIEIIILILIPLTYFLIAITGGKLYWIGGVMFVFVLAYYVFKYINNKYYKK